MEWLCGGMGNFDDRGGEIVFLLTASLAGSNELMESKYFGLLVLGR